MFTIVNKKYIMDIKEKFGRRIRLLRKEKGFSQEELAERSGLNRPYISAIEQGKRNVSLEVMEKLAGALGIEIDQLFLFS
jgi:transcriptional regulator with XRE-family HTH domain